MVHVDDFIYDQPSNNDEEKYAKWFLHLKRLPAALQSEWSSQIDQFRLFCTYNGNRYRVTGCSRMGDIWLTSDFNKDHGYDYRVDLAECSQWSKKEIHNS